MIKRLILFLNRKGHKYIRREAPSAPPLGELLSEREAEGVCYEIQDTLQNTNDTLSVSPFGLPAFNRGMIATGNHNFEKFAALCNTLSGEPRRLRRCGRLRATPAGTWKA